MVGGVAGEDVRQTRLDTEAQQRQQPGLLPLRLHLELLVAEFHAGLFMGLSG